MRFQVVNSNPTVISLFAGGGGSSLGYKLAGYEELLAVEWNDHACETLKANFPELQVWKGDIHDLSGDQCLELAGLAPGELDVLDGSPPCQGFSTAGKRKFMDPRNNLFAEYIRLLRALMPRVFIAENVSGMVKGPMRMIFLEVMKELRASGYRVKAALLNAMHFGVPQSRERCIFIGVRDDLEAEPSHPRPQTKPMTVRQAIGDLGNEQDPERDHIWIDESPAGRNTKAWSLANKAKQGMVYRGQQMRHVWDTEGPTLCKPGSDGWEKPPYLGALGCHPIYTRTFSLLEYKRLASFPDDFIFPGNKWLGYYRIGNCVPPLMMKAIAEHVKTEILEKIPEVQHAGA